MVDDLFGRPPVQRPGGGTQPTAAPLVDALFSTADATVLSTHGLREAVLGPLTTSLAASGSSSRAPRPGDDHESAGASPTQHLLFLVHGIGEHQDFHDDKIVSWDGSEGAVGGNHEFRQLLASVAANRLGEASLSLTVASVEWHSALRAPITGDLSTDEAPTTDALLAACSPAGVSNLRSFTRDNVMDVLYYTSVPHAQLIVNTVGEKMRKRWESFLLERPGWNGSVHLLGHSLGSLIVLDMITHAGTTWHGVTYPPLPFPIANVYVCGSPAPLFLIARKQVRAVTSAEEAAASPSTPLPCDAFFNIVNASDPIAHLYRPFIAVNPDALSFRRSGATVQENHHSGVEQDNLARHRGPVRVAIRSAVTHKSLVEAQRSPPPPHVLQSAAKALPSGASLAELLAVVREMEATRAMIDHHMTPKAAWTAVGAALNSPVAHASYWFSEEVCLFVLCQMLVPWAKANILSEARCTTPAARRSTPVSTPMKTTPSKADSAAHVRESATSALPRTPSREANRTDLATGAVLTPGSTSKNQNSLAMSSPVPNADDLLKTPLRSMTDSSSDLSPAPPLELSVGAHAVGVMETRCSVTGRWSAALVALQRGTLYVLPAKSSELPHLVGSIHLASAIASVPPPQAKRAGYFTLHAPHASRAGARVYELYSSGGIAKAAEWACAINNACGNTGGENVRIVADAADFGGMATSTETCTDSGTSAPRSKSPPQRSTDASALSSKHDEEATFPADATTELPMKKETGFVLHGEPANFTARELRVGIQGEAHATRGQDDVTACDGAFSESEDESAEGVAQPLEGPTSTSLAVSSSAEPEVGRGKQVELFTGLGSDLVARHVDGTAAPLPSGSELRGLFGARRAGLLQKRGRSSLSRWKIRWFVLHDESLLYFSHEPVLAKPSLVASVLRASLRIHRPKLGDPPEDVATTFSWALGDGRAVFLRASSDHLKQWVAACHALKIPVEHNFSV
mmetsp:Transcript_4620/g.13069  ORF Transcript_4620/g.13069 Transcript_4620/m.13069 type:complete len:973 (-) Transcript_4620:328-3246(-)